MMKFLLVFCLVLFFLHSPNYAQRAYKQDGSTPILVGVRVEPPFVIRDTDGSYYGLSVDLWHFLNEDLKFDYEYQEYSSLIELITALSRREIDIAINPLTVSGAKLRTLDVTQPYFISSIGVATTQKKVDTFRTFVNVFSTDLLKIIGVIFLIVLFVGILIWLIESQSNHQFSRSFYGILDGIWWAIVTMTTVGYGDKTPQTILGRAVSMLWMLCAMVIISLFTATVTSTLTINNLEYEIKKLDDVKDLGRIGVIGGSHTEDYLKTNDLKIAEHYNTALEGLYALERKEIDAFIGEKPIIDYLIKHHRLDDNIRIMPVTLNQQFCSWLMPPNSPHLKRINTYLVDKISTNGWKEILGKYNLDKHE